MLTSQNFIRIIDKDENKYIEIIVGVGSPYVAGYNDAMEWSEYTDLSTGDKWIKVKDKCWKKIKLAFEE